MRWLGDRAVSGRVLSVDDAGRVRIVTEAGAKYQFEPSMETLPLALCWRKGDSVEFSKYPPKIGAFPWKAVRDLGMDSRTGHHASDDGFFRMVPTTGERGQPGLATAKFGEPIRED